MVKRRFRMVVIRMILDQCPDRGKAARVFTQNALGAVGLAALLVIWGLAGIPDFKARQVPLHNLADILCMLTGVMTPLFLLGWFCAGLKKSLARSKTVAEIAADLGVGPAEISAWVEQNGFAPSFVIGAETLYDAEEIDLTKVLLRASADPKRAENLLRPTVPATTTPSNELLRPEATKNDPA